MFGVFGLLCASRIAAKLCSCAALVLALSVQVAATAATPTPDRTWTGASSALWSDANNWSPAGVPANGETLLFPSVPPAQRTSTNDLPGLVIDTFLFAGTGYTLNGAGVVLSGGITLSANANTDDTLALPIDVQANAVTINADPSYGSFSLTLAGALSGSGPISVRASYVTLSGSLDNYSGTITVETGGYVETDATSSAGITFINNRAVVLDGAALPNASIQDGSGYSYVGGSGTIGALAAKRLAPSGVLHTGDLAITGANAAFHNLGGASADQIDVTGTVTVYPATTLNAWFAPSWMPAPGQELVLIDNDGNDAINGTFANMPEGSIITSNFVAYRLSYIGGSGNDLTLTCVSTPDHTWTGASSALWSDANNWSPAGVPGNGETLLFPQLPAAQQTSTNDLPGLVVNGLLFTGSYYTIDGDGIVLGGGITLLGYSDDTLALPIDVQANAVTIAADPSYGSFSLTLAGALSGSGPISVQASHLTLSGTLDNYTGTLTVETGGYLGTDVTSNAALKFVNNRALVLDGASLPNASVQDGTGLSYVGGSGTIGPVAAKRLAPSGVLHTGDLAITGANAAFHNLGGQSADRIDVTGSITIDHASTLNTWLDVTWIPVVGQGLILINNDGNDAINGTFANMPEGTIITSNFISYKLSYIGGDGNDLTLTCVTAPAHTWTGASSALWSDANNWSPAGVPANGETLLFPSVPPAQRTSTNDLPGLVIDTFLFAGTGYTLNGAGVVLSGGITLSANANTDDTLALPIDVQANAVTINADPSYGSFSLTLAGALSGSGSISVRASYVTLSGSLDNYSGTITVETGGYVETDATSSAGITFINNRAVVLDGAALPNASIQDGSGYSYVGGSGTIGALAAKRLAPSGVLHTGDLAITGANAAFHNLGGASADQIDVTGTVTVYPATTLNAWFAPSWVPAPGQELVLIDNDGNEPINGMFANMPEGTIIISNFVPYAVSYHGGDGNDVVLIAYPAQAVTTTTITSTSPAVAVVGQSVVVSYSVAGGQNPGGNVTVAATTGETCSDTVAAGQCAIVFTTAGARSLSAAYGGDASNGSSTSQPVALGVDPAITATAIVSATPDPSLVGDSVLVTASASVIAPGMGTPSGIIVVSAPDSGGCTISLPSTTCTLTFATSGVKLLNAHYSGTADFLASNAVPVAHSVNDPPSIDLAITIDDSLFFAEGGQPTTYLIVVQNNGTGDSHNAAMQANLPVNLSNAIWTCAPITGNATCAPSGSGSILDLVDLPAGSAVIYALSADVASLPEQPLVQTASISVAAGETDSNPANNAATDIDSVGIFLGTFDPQ